MLTLITCWGYVCWVSLVTKLLPHLAFLPSFLEGNRYSQRRQLCSTSWRAEYLCKLFPILHGRSIFSPSFIYFFIIFISVAHRYLSCTLYYNPVLPYFAAQIVSVLSIRNFPLAPVSLLLWLLPFKRAFFLFTKKQRILASQDAPVPLGYTAMCQLCVFLTFCLNQPWLQGVLVPLLENGLDPDPGTRFLSPLGCHCF